MSLNLLKQYDIIIFDCDGVIMDTNILKCLAFGKAVEGYPSQIVNEFVEHCKNTFGISRYVKFKEFFSEFASEPFQEEKYNNFLKKYADLCAEAYRTAEITPGCERLLTELSIMSKNVYVASGSDEKELNEVFKIRNLSRYFKGIYGSPKTKLECTSIILKNATNKNGVFIGDALSDMNTAREYNLDFIYMSKYSIQSKAKGQLCEKGAIKVIDTLEMLI